MSEQKDVQSISAWPLIIVGAGGVATILWAFTLFYGAWNLLLKPLT
jgi:hypothetical protein